MISGTLETLILEWVVKRRRRFEKLMQKKANLHCRRRTRRYGICRHRRQKRGHDVTLDEKDDKFGGQINLIGPLPGKYLEAVTSPENRLQQPSDLVGAVIFLTAEERHFITAKPSWWTE